MNYDKLIYKIQTIKDLEKKVQDIEVILKIINKFKSTARLGYAIRIFAEENTEDKMIQFFNNNGKYSHNEYVEVYFEEPIGSEPTELINYLQTKKEEIQNNINLIKKEIKENINEL